MKNDLHGDLLATWVRFCKRCVAGARLWIADEEFERLSEALSANQRFYEPDPYPPYRIDFRGGYQWKGVSFYRKSAYARTATP